MFLIDRIGYLNITNSSSRITGLSIMDPFVIFCFILLSLVVIVALILLTITSRVSAESIWDGIQHEARFGARHRSARISTLINDTNTKAASGRYDDFVNDCRDVHTTASSKHVGFKVAAIPGRSGRSRYFKDNVDETTERLLPLSLQAGVPVTAREHMSRRSQMPLPSPYTAFSQQAFDEARASSTFPMYSITLNDIHVQAGVARQPPKVNFRLEREESKRRWTKEVQKALVSASTDLV
jgi:hypothetical protein